MDIRNTKELKVFAAQRLEQAPDARKIVLCYTGVVLGLSLLLTLADLVLEGLISQTGGLGSMGTRTIFSTIQTILPMAGTVITMCVELGFLSAMLRVARGQYASPKSLRLGFDRFWPLLRLTLLKAVIFLGMGLICVYVATFIYMMTPLSDAAMAVLTPLLSSSTVLDSSSLILDDAAYAQLMSAMAPVFLICAGLFCVAAVPVWYQYRMAEYVLIDRPALGAIACLRESRKMMRARRFRLFCLDLSMWWYYAAAALSTVICYGDVILALMGVSLPLSEDAAYFLFYGLYLLVQAAIYCGLRSRVEVTYALAYDALRPQEQPQNAVVLGNIFNM